MAGIQPITLINVYNPLTGLVSPQYHVVFNKNFITVEFLFHSTNFGRTAAGNTPTNTPPATSLCLFIIKLILISVANMKTCTSARNRSRN
mmetsp:Transcript_18376/g.27764  ORF Transcript_18376/g.27764 Transcript_18376/m.27764 type:complete len:90 (-) Transcript_18376:11-280(-)